MSKAKQTPVWVYLALVFVVLQTLDGVLTSIGMHFYGQELEANPIAAYTFAKLGTLQSAIAWKVFSFALFFGLLGYCIYLRWSMLDIVGLLWRREPKRDKTYAMSCFYVAGFVVIPATLYASGGWAYILIYLKLAVQ